MKQEFRQSACRLGGGIMSVEMVETVSAKVMWPQWITGFAALLLQAQLGFMGGWTSPYIGVLTSPESLFTITMEELSWVVSLLNMGRLLGAITGALCVNYFGSKTTTLMISVPVFLCWLFVMLATNVWWLYSSRFLGGLCLGMLYSSFSLYMGEVADPSIRGTLVALSMSGLPIGSFLMCVMGPYLSMSVSSAICLGPCLIMMILFVWLPESPHHLIKMRQDEKAKSSIKWYHRDCDVEQEFLSLKKFVDNCNGQTFLESLMEFRRACYLKSILIITVLFTFSQFCGLNNMLAYMETIFKNAEVTVVDPAVAVIVVVATGIVGSALSAILMDRCGRKVLFIVSCIGLVISYGSLTITFQLLSFDVHSKSLDGLTIFAMMLLSISVYIGLLTVPPAILSELFPPHLKCIAACYASSVAGIMGFITTLTYLPLIELMTEQYVYLFYGLLLLACVPFIQFCVPETKGLSLQEIQRRLVKKQ